MQVEAKRIWRIAISWALKLSMAGLFAFASHAKLTGAPWIVAEFEMVGLGQWFRYFTGGLEVIGILAMLAPRISVLGALILLVIDVGAGFAAAFILQIDWLHTIAMGAALVAIIHLERDQVPALRKAVRFSSTWSPLAEKA